jgi:glycyl-tRNA synthetase (class II)
MAFKGELVKKVIEIVYHRNGISGTGFHVVKFLTEGKTPMMAVVFPTEGHVSVFDSASLEAGTINNPFRGDHFEAELRQAIAESEQ